MQLQATVSQTHKSQLTVA